MKRKSTNIPNGILNGGALGKGSEQTSHCNNEERRQGMLHALQSVEDKRLSSDERAELWERIGKTNSKYGKTKLLVRFAKYGGVACVIIMLMVLFWERETTVNSSDLLLQNALANQGLILQEGEVTVVQGDGEPLMISAEKEFIDLSQGIVPNNGHNDGSQTFRTLTVPYGRRVEVVLPDNSKVWLNAGSQLTLPLVFDKGERRVYLEGEGYFDVDTDARRPFYVHTADMVIKVLGTTFNISSYKDDTFTSTVLLSGEIELNSAGEVTFEPRTLIPGTAAVLSKNNNQLSISQQPVESYVSWTQKQLILEKTSLAEIIRRLERFYNTDIVIEGKMEAEETFSGRLDLTQSLASLLNTLYNPVEYQLQQKERRVIVKKK